MKLYRLLLPFVLLIAMVALIVGVTYSAYVTSFPETTLNVSIGLLKVSDINHQEVQFVDLEPFSTHQSSITVSNVGSFDAQVTAQLIPVWQAYDVDSETFQDVALSTGCLDIALVSGGWVSDRPGHYRLSEPLAVGKSLPLEFKLDVKELDDSYTGMCATVKVYVEAGPNQ